MGGGESRRGLVEQLERRILLSTFESVGYLGGPPGPPLGNLTDNNGTLLYVNNDSIYGPELWRSDGVGAAMVKDIHRGAGGGFVLAGDSYYQQPERDNDLVTVGGRTFFVADDGVTAAELWVSDGSRAGTYLVRDIVKGAGASLPSYLTNVNGTLFFFTGDGSTALQLWKSDGTRRGTVEVKDLGASNISPPSFPGTNYIQAGKVAVVGDSFYFLMLTGGGTQLWKSDGRTSGTVQLTPGVSLTSAGLYAAGTRLYLIDGAGGDLLSIDPVSGAATRLADFAANANIGVPIALVGGGTAAVFGVGVPVNGEWPRSFEIWTTDGTAGGTRKLLAHPSYGSFNFQAVRLGTAVFMTDGTALYRTDGTAGGTRVVKEDMSFGYGTKLVALDESIYYTANDALHRVVDDGSAPVVVATLRRREGEFSATNLIASGGRLYFIGLEPVYMRGNELWAFNPQSPRKKLRMVRSLQNVAVLRKGRLTVPGTDWGDNVRVTADAKHGTLALEWDGMPTQTYRLKDVASVLIEGRGSADSIMLVGRVPRATVSGGYGSDDITGGNGDDVLQGDVGDDRLTGGAGNDDLYGGAGDDTLDGGAGEDVFIGGGDLDTADYGGRRRNLNVTLDGIRGDGERGEGDNVMADMETVWGGSGNDYLVGSMVRTPSYMSHDGELDGGEGADTMIGGRGNDSLVGGSRADSIEGGGGNDTIYGDNYYADPEVVYGDDTLGGGLGDDSMNGGGGDDVMAGGKGHDSMYGGDGNDALGGGWGYDSIAGEGGDDTLSGDAENDNLSGGDGNDLIHGGDDNDALTDGAGNDTLYGDAGDDVVEGNAGNDELFGGNGNDSVWGDGDERDVVDGGRGGDVGRYDDDDKVVSIEDRWGW
jgi:ELWxxDGT repeat protein